MASVKKKPKPNKSPDELRRLALGATASDSRQKRAEELTALRESSRAALLKRTIEESGSSLMPIDDASTATHADAQNAFKGTEECNESNMKKAKDDSPFQMVLHRGTRRRLKQQQERLDDLRKKAVQRTKGLFKVTFFANEGEECQRKPFPEGSLLAVTEDLRSKIPDCYPSSSQGCLHVWVNSLEVVNQLKQIEELASIKVVVDCKTSDQFWGRISGVDKGFTEGEILASLRDIGVTDIRRETRKLRNGPESKTFPTDRVYLRFSGLPPQKVLLARREYLVILVAEKPPLCYNCQRIGHISLHCKRPKACMKCGGTNHLAAQCRRMARCVNCFQNHPSWFTACPAKLLAVEQRNVLLEARVQAQARHAHQDATIVEKVRCNSGPSKAVKSQLLSEVSYADAVAGRTIVIQQSNDEDKEINLPRSVLPSMKRAKKKGLKRPITAKKSLRQYKKGLGRTAYDAPKASVNNSSSASSSGNTGGIQKQPKAFKDPAETADGLNELLATLRCLVPILKLFDRGLADSLQKLLRGLPVLMEALASLGRKTVSKHFPCKV